MVALETHEDEVHQGEQAPTTALAGSTYNSFSEGAEDHTEVWEVPGVQRGGLREVRSLQVPRQHVRFGILIQSK